MQPDDAVLSSNFWLATGALCVVNAGVIEAINNTLPTVPKVFCGNHDDGATEAAVVCTECELSLCHECSDTLHLSRTLKTHTRNPLERHEPSLVMELHEGCGRVKLPLIVALCDRRTLKVSACATPFPVCIFFIPNLPRCSSRLLWSSSLRAGAPRAASVPLHCRKAAVLPR